MSDDTLLAVYLFGNLKVKLRNWFVLVSLNHVAGHVGILRVLSTALTHVREVPGCSNSEDYFHYSEII